MVLKADHLETKRMYSVRFVSVFMLIYTGLASISWAGESACGPVRMDRPPGSVSSMPVVNQGSTTGLCYAAVAAQIADAYLASKGHRTEFVSISHAAALYQGKVAIPNFYRDLEAKLGLPSKIVSGQASEDERQLYSQIRNNIESQVSNPDDPHATQADLDSGEAVSTLRALRENGQACAINWAGHNDAQIESTLYPFLKLRQDVLRSQRTTDFPDRFVCAAKSIFPSDILGQMGDLRAIADKIVNSLPNKGDYIISLIENTCAKKVDLSEMPEPQEMHFSKEDRQSGSLVVTKLHELLDQPRPQPIGITFEGSSLYKNSPSFPHWALVIGREDIGGVCRILIRDSYGTSCNGPFQTNQYKYPCKSGQLSVPLADFRKMEIKALTWLKN